MSRRHANQTRPSTSRSGAWPGAQPGPGACLRVVAALMPLVALVAGAGAVRAQPAAPATPATPTAPGATAAPAPPIWPSVPPVPYTSVAEARASLTARDGNGTVVTNADGWTIINEPALAAQWSFPPQGHEAYPAAVRRIIQRGPNSAVNVQMAVLCEAPADACGKLKDQFDALNTRITQAVRGRGAPPPVTP